MLLNPLPSTRFAPPAITRGARTTVSPAHQQREGVTIPLEDQRNLVVFGNLLKTHSQDGYRYFLRLVQDLINNGDDWEMMGSRIDNCTLNASIYSRQGGRRLPLELNATFDEFLLREKVFDLLNKINRDRPVQNRYLTDEELSLRERQKTGRDFAKIFGTPALEAYNPKKRHAKCD